MQQWSLWCCIRPSPTPASPRPNPAQAWAGFNFKVTRMGSMIPRDNSQRTTKPTRRPVWPAKTQISLYTNPSMTRVLVCPSLNSPAAEEGTCDQRRLWSDCADAQADLSLRWSHKFYCRFCRVLAQIKKISALWWSTRRRFTAANTLAA